MPQQPKGALAGISVLDISEVFQAPLAAQVLGDFGARVVKVERPGSGEILRKLDAHALATGKLSSYYAAANRNKCSVAIDLKTRAGREIVHDLAIEADVLLHNYRPGVMERIGLGYDELAAANPRLVYASATGYGEAGPFADKPGQDMVAQSLSGIAADNYDAHGAPGLISTPVVDFSSGMILAMGILAALLEREKSGRGQKVGICLLDTAIAMQSLEAASLLNYGQRTHWKSQNLNFVFKARDGWLTVLGFFRDNPLRLLCSALEIEDLSEREEFSTFAKQVAGKGRIEEIAQAEFDKYTLQEALERLQAQDILCAPVLTLRQALDHPQVRQNGMTLQVEVEAQDAMTVVANPVRLSRTPAAVYRGPARLGADTFEVLREAGISEARIAEARSQNAFGPMLERPTKA